MSDHTHCIEVCNKLLRGERSAVEAYDKAIERYGDKPVLGDLRRLRAEHNSAVNLLEENVRSMGGQPDSGGGAWAAFASTIQSTANLLGADSALEALRAGEKSGQSDYESALRDEEVMDECRNLITTSLLPKIMEHIDALDRLQEAA